MSAEKLEAVYLVDRQFFLHLKETESGFQYEAFHRSEKKENYSGLFPAASGSCIRQSAQVSQCPVEGIMVLPI